MDPDEGRWPDEPALLAALRRRDGDAFRHLVRSLHAPLVRLARLYDPAAVIAMCGDYYHRAGPGTPPTFSVPILVRAEIVRAWADSCSDPDLEFHLATNLLVRWFVGLPLLGATPTTPRSTASMPG